MPKLTNPSAASKDAMTILSRLLLTPGYGHASLASIPAARNKFEDLLTLANTNHVIVRGLEVLLGVLREAQDEIRAAWAATALAAERARIDNAILFLHAICTAFAEEGHDATVIKSLDHWPDLGSDLDLYTNADPAEICPLMMRRFQAQLAPRSWGDRLAHKWNFLIPGLPEAVEVHMGRLGQTGEQVSIASWLAGRARRSSLETMRFEFQRPRTA